MSGGLILASRSTARARLLADAGVPVSCVPADIDEAAEARSLPDVEASAQASFLAAHLAARKAIAVSARHRGLVLGCDQTLELEGALFRKPVDRADLGRQLRALRGRTHRLHAAVAFARDGRVVRSLVTHASLTMRAFSDAFLDDYLAREGEAAMGCVGGYRLEALGAQLFERIEGDYFTVLGLPLLEVLGALREDGELAR